MYGFPLRIIIFPVSCASLWFGYTGSKSDRVYVKGGRWIRREDFP